MFYDKQLEFSSAQAITTSAASTNVLDLGDRSGNSMEDLDILAKIDTAFTASGSATLQVGLQSATDAAFTTPIDHWLSPAIGKATLVAGYRITLPKIPKGSSVKRYVRLYYTVATGPMTAGALSAAIVSNLQTNGK